MDYYNTTDTYNITMDTYNITTKILWKYYSHLQVYRPAVPTQHYMTLQSLPWLQVSWEIHKVCWCTSLFLTLLFPILNFFNTHYLIKNPYHALPNTIHVGQITEFLKFDEQLWTKGVTNLSSVPLWFVKFTEAWNNDIPSDDSHQISHVFIAEMAGIDHKVEPSSTPVYSSNFFITAEQVGLGTSPNHSFNNNLQSEIMQEFASIMMEQRRKGFKRRQDHRLQGLQLQDFCQCNYNFDMSAHHIKLAHRNKRACWESPSTNHFWAHSWAICLQRTFWPGPHQSSSGKHLNGEPWLAEWLSKRCFHHSQKWDQAHIQVKHLLC